MRDPAPLAPNPEPAQLETIRALLGRARFAGLIFPALIGGLLLASEAEPWRWALIGAAALVLTAHVLLVRRPSPGGFVALAGFGQLCGVLCTGGLRSPFIVLPVATALWSGLLLRGRQLAVAALAPVALVATLTLLEVQGIELLPRILRAEDPTGRVLWPVLFVLVMVFAGGFGARVGLAVRGALQHSDQASALAQREAMETTRERNRELHELSQAIAHELKNPLAAIQGLSTLLERKAAPGSPEAERLGVLVSEARRMGQILEGFMNLSRPIRELSLERASLAGLAGEVLLVHEGLARERRVRLRPELDREVRPTCDPRKVKQVLVNLLQNAIDAAPPESDVVVRVAPAEGERALLSVADAGPGLPAAVRDQPFRPGLTTKRDGNGLGLVLARAIAVQHGGELTLLDGAAGGTIAELRLPLGGPAELVPEASAEGVAS